MGPKSVVEVGVEVTANQLKGIECFLRSRNIPFYIETVPEVPYASIEDLECQCEGK